MQQKQRMDGKGRPMLPIIVLLLSMASLAERAARLPAPVRYLMLYFLQRGERSAYTIVDWELRKRGAPLQWAAPDHARKNRDPDAALSLAEWFRILALSLRDLPRRALIVERREAFRRLAAICAQHPAHQSISVRPLAPDTS